MNRLAELAEKYDFDFDFVTDFNEEINYDQSMISDFAAVSTDPKKILPDCKTVVVLVFKYDASLEKSNIASFAWGKDYHTRISEISTHITPLFKDAQFIVDGTKLNERYFAGKSNLGYIGKNSLFISDKYGSYCNIALILTSEELKTNRSKSRKSCSECNKCIDACPASAIDEQIDCRKCIAEKLQKRNNLNFDYIGNNIYGCEICQQVCPHNINRHISNLSILNIDLEKNLFLTKNEFKVYQDTTFSWIGYRSFIRNVHVAYVKTTGDLSKLEFLENSNSLYLKEVAKKIKGE